MLKENPQVTPSRFNRTSDTTDTIFCARLQVWSVHKVLYYLHALVNKSFIRQQLDGTAVDSPFVQSTLYKMMGYFSMRSDIESFNTDCDPGPWVRRCVLVLQVLSVCCVCTVSWGITALHSAPSLASTLPKRACLLASLRATSQRSTTLVGRTS